MPILPEPDPFADELLPPADLGLEAFQAQRLFRETHQAETASVRRFLADPTKVARARQHYKTYDRAERIPLDLPVEPLTMALQEVIERRQTVREFDPDRPLSLRELSRLLWLVAGLKEGDSGARHYPSPGALYAHEIYVANLRIEGLAPGFYHLNVRDRCLERVSGGDALARLPDLIASSELEGARRAGAGIFLTAVFERLTQKYGRRGWKFCQFETGCLLAGVYSVATASGLGAWPIGNIIEDELLPALGIDGVHEGFMTSVFVGWPMATTSALRDPLVQTNKKFSLIRLICERGAAIFSSRGRRKS